MSPLPSRIAFLSVAAWPVAFLLSGPTEGRAQSVDVGERVRVQTPALGPGPVQGRVLEVDEEGFLLGTSPRELEGIGPATDGTRISFEELTGLERFDGRKGHGGVGALIGSAVGVLVGLAVIWTTDSQWANCSGDEEGLCLMVVGGAAAGGALAGLVVGATIRTDRWRPVSIELR